MVGATRWLILVVGLPWSESIDLFSLGCVLAEVYLGHRLFPFTGTDLERLAVLERVIGPFPESMVVRGERCLRDSFTLQPGIRVNFPGDCAYPRNAVRYVLSAPTLSVSTLVWVLLLRLTQFSQSIILDHSFFNLCNNLMQMDPEERHAAADYEVHPFLLAVDSDVLFGEPLTPIA